MGDEIRQFKVAIVEDDDTAARRLTDCLARYSEENNILILSERFNNAESFLESYKPGYSVVFFDIELGGEDGMSAAKKLRSIDEIVSVIFITNMGQYAVMGYEVDALAYMLKPVLYDDLKLKLQKAFKHWDALRNTEFMVQLSNGFHRISSDNLLYVEVMGHKLRYHTIGGNIDAGGSLSSVEKLLESKGFLRCNACFLVNPKHIVCVRGYTLKIGDDELVISHPKRKEFIRKLMCYYTGGRIGDD